MSNRTESNSYTVIFAIIMVIIVGALLAGVSSALSDRISENRKFEKQQNVLYAMGVNRNQNTNLGEGDVTFVPTNEVTAEFKKYIKGQYFIKGNQAVEADLIEDPKWTAEKGLPLFVGEKDSKTFYIIPVFGKGLWDAIWGYVAVDKDLIVQGVFFDHKGETAGLGSNIKERFFMDDFIGEHLLDASGNFQSVEGSKSNGDPENKRKEDGKVDAIAGATLTVNGVNEMVKTGVGAYVDYIKNLKN
ncbi:MULTISPECIES: Na(+)-translocating NADH-quinone reductase subunit C [Capnocytophaga]|uniref:Na(+)-translocating NADH-quinone reductase subunit C n=2 Tax=Capnocytophaga TaxID=1016 RepID=A0A0B7H7M9_9FLAO|nr:MULTISPECIES: Na(+)-translocating NADH-quinone reductase subunit C [Capnocytophaga]ATA76142.1 Na(+)-translocating NADH-quinone reductase subunit C [Capnocytophaga canimorsus]ATA90744.1 Na(+)-translocating NADH-quinone reductase subunit C [Capnocytophaga canimorsus]ATA92894.1 Na(+)-translocating NADH-quinone reductase subunit C [Capnocytophaga canimorsus]AYW36107.1 Na(+)-translocating NADH-quinone reductase subunit C [Capnocytophaga canimorsus]PJI80342.1 Na+-transporting NADH:ubiquinone oxid